ncbi:hypothetical protein BHE74_00050169 [Ensete ventricosum]|nr:hypothetical protein BHE74_00050169 [Ensete ventricosum]RZS24796.1 hypothetical protein BHM03_00057907 [Ensete ventricosum]
MGGVVSYYPSHSGRDLRPIDNRRENTPSDLTCVKFEEILRLAQQCYLSIQSHSDKAKCSKRNFI